MIRFGGVRYSRVWLYPQHWALGQGGQDASPSHKIPWVLGGTIIPLCVAWQLQAVYLPCIFVCTGAETPRILHMTCCCTLFLFFVVVCFLFLPSEFSVVRHCTFRFGYAISRSHVTWSLTLLAFCVGHLSKWPFSRSRHTPRQELVLGRSGKILTFSHQALCRAS